MEEYSLELNVLPERFAVCRLEPDAEVPGWTGVGGLVSITRTADELSVVCPEDRVPEGVRCERAWRALRVAGTLDMSLNGVLASLVGPLARAAIPVFVLSTFDTDWLLVRDREVTRARDALRRAGHRFSR